MLVSQHAKLAKPAAIVRHRAASAPQAPPAPKHHSSPGPLSASASQATWARTAGAGARVDDSALAARSSAPRVQVRTFAKLIAACEQKWKFQHFY